MESSAPFVDANDSGGEMEPMSQSDWNRFAKPMRWAARAIALVGAIYFMVVLIGSAINEGVGPITIEGATIAVLGLVALVGCVASWWRERLAGILLIGTAVGLGIHIGICAGQHHLLVWSVTGLPYLVAGLLLLGSLRLSRQDTQQHLCALCQMPGPNTSSELLPAAGESVSALAQSGVDTP